MRIATAFTYDQSIANLQSRQQQLATSQQQLTSGKRVNYASDDPTSAARAERALASLSRNEADRNVMTVAESALGTATDLLQTARETLVDAGNGSYSDSDRASLAVKLANIRTQLLTVANTSDGGGGFVFGGAGSSTSPFVDTATGVAFQGQTGESLASSSDKLNLGQRRVQHGSRPERQHHAGQQRHRLDQLRLGGGTQPAALPSCGITRAGLFRGLPRECGRHHI